MTAARAQRGLDGADLRQRQLARQDLEPFLRRLRGQRSLLSGDYTGYGLGKSETLG